MKQPMFLISTAGKSKEQMKNEAREAFLRYQKVESQVLQKISQQKPQPQREDEWEVLVRLPQDTDEPKEVFRPKPQEKPSTTPPVKTPRLSTEEFWKQFDKTKEHLGGAIQITNYPHTRKSPPPPVETNSPEIAKDTPREKLVPSSLPQRLLIPLNLSAEEALAAVKKFFSDYQGIKLLSK